MTDLSEQAIIDLSSVAIDRCEKALKDVLQLVDNDKQRMIIAVNASALIFGMAACFLQDHYEKTNGAKIPWDTAVNNAVHYIAKMAIETPRPAARTPQESESEADRG